MSQDYYDTIDDQVRVLFLGIGPDDTGSEPFKNLDTAIKEISKQLANVEKVQIGFSNKPSFSKEIQEYLPRVDSNLLPKNVGD